MKGLFDPAGRRRLAGVIVWGTPPRLLSRTMIASRLEKVLERIANKLQARASQSN